MKKVFKVESKRDESKKWDSCRYYNNRNSAVKAECLLKKEGVTTRVREVLI